MSEDNLKWKIPSLFKGINPADAYNEIERIKEKHDGSVTAKILLAESRDPNSVFYRYFNWNDADAAEKFRLSQARDLLRNIEVHIIADGAPKHIRVYEVVKMENGNGVYKDIETLNSDDVDYIAQSTIKQISLYKTKLSNYEQFQTVVSHLNGAITELENIVAVKEM